MYDFIEHVHKALGIESTWAFVLVVSLGAALIAALVFGCLAWVVDATYKNSPEYKAEHSPKQQTVTATSSAAPQTATVQGASDQGMPATVPAATQKTKSAKRAKRPRDRSTPSMSQECAPGASCAVSIGQQGGITAATIIGVPLCPWDSLTEKDFIKVAQLLSASRAKIFIAIQPSNDKAARFAGYLQPALKTISHWNADDFVEAYGSFWAKYPGITVIARDRNEFSDVTRPAAQLKNAIQSLGLTVHSEPVPTLNANDDVGLWVGACE